MKLPGPTLPELHLHPAEMVVTQKAQWVITILGSCVAVTLFTPRFPLAAICHARLPEPRPTELPGPEDPERFSFLSCALPEMVASFLRVGVRPEEIQVKLFGGANVINLGVEPSDQRWIGTANVATARRLIQSAGLRVIAENVGGGRGCKILFNTQTGDVFHKHLAQSSRSP